MLKGDCCPDFESSCPDVNQDTDKRKTSCHVFNYVTLQNEAPLVGLQTVIGCPQGSQKDIETKCNGGFGDSEKVIRYKFLRFMAVMS